MIRTLLLAALLAAAATNASAAEMTDLTRCRAIGDVSARAECYDRIVDAAVARGEKKVTPPEFNPKPVPAPTQKTVALTEATRGGNGRVLMATTDGEVWVQTEGEPLSKLPNAGTSMTIRRGAMGGFFCSLDKYTSFRCSQRRD